MTYYLGFDGGGSKTECVVLDASGQVIAQATAGPSNPLRVGIAPRAKISSLSISPVVGAARLARRLSGAPSSTAAHGANP